MANDIIPKIDLIKDSLANLLGISFGKSSSPSYPLAISVAQGAKMYEELILGSNTVHMAIFDKSRDGAARAMSLLLYISEWKSTQIYGGGKLLQNYYRISEVLRCYLSATACEDRRAHCHMVIDDPYQKTPHIVGYKVMLDPYYEPKEIRVDRYIFPCSLLHQNFSGKTSEHPSGPAQQIQAEAISVSCDICPYFNSKEYVKIGEKVTTY